MKQVYGQLAPLTGPHIAGICSIQICPVEFLAALWTCNFFDGKVNDVALVPGRQMINISFLPNTYKFNETPKSNRGGAYYETSLTGTCNDIDVASLQIMNTYRYHEWMAIVTDRQGRLKVVG